MIRSEVLVHNLLAESLIDMHCATKSPSYKIKESKKLYLTPQPQSPKFSIIYTQRNIELNLYMT